ncbi:MAG: hypothetical protein E7291_05440 [Lachnospiraceae bacterium]|nr:hypothetical protein [Lachnospiraceae bacterium]
MKKICFTILILFSSMMMGCASLNTSINASEDESEAFGVIENATVEENSEQEESSTDVESQQAETTEAPTEAVLSEEDITEVVFEKELKETDNPRIAEILNVSGTHFDGFNRDHYHYQIPQFNADSESAKVVNKRIEDDLSEIIEQEAAHISGGYSLVTQSVTYEIFEYGAITAIVVTVPYPNDCMDYLAYTYDFQNDKELTNTELLAMNMMTEEDFVTGVCRLQADDFIELAKNWSNPMTDQEMINGYIANVNAYATVDLPMYFDGKGTLQVYVPFASIAGADWYYQLCQF